MLACTIVQKPPQHAFCKDSKHTTHEGKVSSCGTYVVVGAADASLNKNACSVNLIMPPFFQEQCVTSTSMNVPSTRVTTGAHVSMASTASPACARRATTTPPACLRWTSVAATPVSTAAAKISSTGEHVIHFSRCTSCKTLRGYLNNTRHFLACIVATSVPVIPAGVDQTVTSTTTNANPTRA